MKRTVRYFFGAQLCALALSWLSIVHAGPAAPVAAPDPALTGELARLSGSNRFLFFGEMHGSREVPALVLALSQRLVDDGHAVVVALEMPERLGDLLTRYLATREPASIRRAILDDEFWTWRDGRSSQAMLALIDGLRMQRAAGHAVEVAAFDANQTRAMTAPVREERMAANLGEALAEFPSHRFLVLAGNYHARMARGTPHDPEHEHAAWRVRDLDPYTLNVTASTGSVWVCTPDCGPYPFGLAKPAGPSDVVLFDALSDIGYRGDVKLPSFSASPPAIELVELQGDPAVPED